MITDGWRSFRNRGCWSPTDAAEVIDHRLDSSERRAWRCGLATLESAKPALFSLQPSVSPGSVHSIPPFAFAACLRQLSPVSNVHYTELFS